jgi:hypothetical protein
MALRFFKKRSDVIDFTDRGKNIPEIKTDYGITKDGFIEFKDKNPKDSFIINGQPKVSDTNTSSNFDFLNDMAMGTANSNSSFQPNSFTESSDSEVKKQLRSVSSMAEQNNNELYRLLQRIELLERKIARLEGKESS